MKGNNGRTLSNQNISLGVETKRTSGGGVSLIETLKDLTNETDKKNMGQVPGKSLLRLWLSTILVTFSPK